MSFNVICADNGFKRFFLQFGILSIVIIIYFYRFRKNILWIKTTNIFVSRLIELYCTFVKSYTVRLLFLLNYRKLSTLELTKLFSSKR